MVLSRMEIVEIKKNFDNNMNLEKSCDNALATAENNDLVYMILHDTEAIDFVNPSYADNLNECLPDNIISFSGTEICDAVEQKIENVGSPIIFSPSNYSLNEPTQILNETDEIEMTCGQVMEDYQPELSEDINNTQVVVVTEVYNKNMQLPSAKVLYDNGLLTEVNNNGTIELYDGHGNKMEECSLKVDTFENYESATVIDINNINYVDNNTNNVTDVNNDINGQRTEKENNTGEEVSEEIDHNENNSEVVLKPKRRKRHQVVEEEWENKKAKILREQGKDYIGRKYVDGKFKEYVTRPKRELKPITCKCKGQTYHCKYLTDAERTKIFNDFWEMNWMEKKYYVRSLTDINITQRS